MKLIDFLKILDKNTFVTLGIAVSGMQFETEHSAEFFIDNADEINNRKIKTAYVTDGKLHIRLED